MNIIGGTIAASALSLLAPACSGEVVGGLAAGGTLVLEGVKALQGTEVAVLSSTSGKKIKARRRVGVGLKAEYLATVHDAFKHTAEPDDLTIEIDDKKVQGVSLGFGAEIENREVTPFESEHYSGGDAIQFFIEPHEVGTHSLRLSAENAKEGVKFTYEACEPKDCKLEMDDVFEGPSPVLLFGAIDLSWTLRCVATDECSETKIDGVPPLTILQQGEIAESNFWGHEFYVKSAPHELILKNEEFGIEKKFLVVDERAVEEIVPDWDVDESVVLVLGHRARLEIEPRGVDGAPFNGLNEEYVVTTTGPEQNIEPWGFVLLVTAENEGITRVSIEWGSALLEFDLEVLSEAPSPLD